MPRSCLTPSLSNGPSRIWKSRLPRGDVSKRGMRR
jgi:hypothetical protein